MRKAWFLFLFFWIGLAACDGNGLNGAASTPTPTPATAPAGNPSNPPAQAVAQQFTDALNVKDFDTAFNTLDTLSQAQLGNADALRQAYESAWAEAKVITATLSIGGILQGDVSTSIALRTQWLCNEFGMVELTSYLYLTTNPQTQQWRISWTRDAIAPGLAKGRLLVLRTPASARASIYFDDGSVAARPEEITTLGVQRGAIKDAAQEQAMLAALSQITGLDADRIRAKYADQPADWFTPIAALPPEKLEENAVLLNTFDAVLARRGYTRAYTQTNLAPHVVGWVGAITAETLPTYKARGYTGDETVGVSGIEAAMEQVLIGSPEITLNVVDGNDDFKVIAKKEFVRAQDVTLTLVPSLQRRAQSLLQSNGAAVVMNVRDGSILAMASYPSFDAMPFTQSGQNDARLALLNDPRQPMLNRTMQAVYPPGSVFKMVTMAAGLSEGVSNSQEVFYDPGYWDDLGKDYRKTCWLGRGHGRISLQDGLSASCNIVFYSLGKRLDERGQNLLPTYAQQFGFGAPSGIELSGEAAGVVPSPEWKTKNVGEVWTTGDTVNMSIGQGFLLVSPLQITQLTAAIANGGTLPTPHVVGKIGDTTVAVSSTQTNISPAVLAAVQRGMFGTVNNARVGTAQNRFATLDGYVINGQVVSGKQLTNAQKRAAQKLTVAGKTGTAQASGNAKPYAWFTAYAPADNPEIAVTVMFENVGEGSEYAAPVARQILESYFGLGVVQ